MSKEGNWEMRGRGKVFDKMEAAFFSPSAMRKCRPEVARPSNASGEDR